jgi:hypothetical protein
MRVAAIPLFLAAATCSASNFHFDVGIHFGVPEREVIVVREQRVPDHEIPVVFFIARHARVAPATVVNLRVAGLEWWDIAARLRVSPEVFYVAGGPPYGHAHGHRRKHRLRDVEIVECVNVRFLSEYHRVPAERIYIMRSRGLDYAAVHSSLGEPRHHGHKRGKGKHHRKDDD